MDKSVIDAAVQLANAGAAGVSVFAILWSGYLLGIKKVRNQNIQFYMALCLALTIVTAITSNYASRAKDAETKVAQCAVTEKKYDELKEKYDGLKTGIKTMGPLVTIKTGFIEQILKERKKKDAYGDSMLKTVRAVQDEEQKLLYAN